MSRLSYIIFSCIGLCLFFIQCKDAPVTEKVVASPTVEMAQKAPDSITVAKQILDNTASTESVVTSEKSIEKEAAVTKKVATKIATTTDRKEAPKPVVKKKKKRRAKIKFNELVHKFGTIKTGDKVKHQFKFKNIGNAPLVIKSVDVSCGCTFPSYPFLPIEPGKDGMIDVTFDSEHKVGRQKPTITVVTNARPRTIKLNLEGFVE